MTVTETGIIRSAQSSRTKNQTVQGQRQAGVWDKSYGWTTSLLNMAVNTITLQQQVLFDVVHFGHMISNLIQ